MIDGKNNPIDTPLNRRPALVSSLAAKLQPLDGAAAVVAEMVADRVDRNTVVEQLQSVAVVGRKLQYKKGYER